jgi:hypothetical protein
MTTPVLLSIFPARCTAKFPKLPIPLALGDGRIDVDAGLGDKLVMVVMPTLVGEGAAVAVYVGMVVASRLPEVAEGMAPDSVVLGRDAPYALHASTNSAKFQSYKFSKRGQSGSWVIKKDANGQRFLVRGQSKVVTEIER